jgi:hypothetical protein
MLILLTQSAGEANPRSDSAVAGLFHMCLQDIDSWRG